MRKKRLLGIFIILLFLVLTIIIGGYIIDFSSNEGSFKSLISNIGIFGYIFFVFLTVLQVVFALIPSEALELAAGFTFGPFLGAILSIIGLCIGSSIVIVLTKKYGRRFVNLFYTNDKINEIKLFKNERKLIPLIFIMYLIPGTPKDIIIYVVGFTKLKVSTYLLVTTFARTPSVLISTIAGGAVRENNIELAIIFFSISVITGIVGFLIYKFIFLKKEATSK